ncbi:MAG TPA: DNA repair protein RadC [bacterium]|nr:DNA repair protein RadC [bacterium]
MVKQITELFKDDKPREKVAKKGPGALRTFELIALILGSGGKGHPIFELSRDIERALGDDPEKATFETLKKIPGVGAAKAAQIVAAFELGRRYRPADRPKMLRVEDVVSLCGDYRHKKQEYFVTVTLDGAGTLINERVVFIGTLNQSLVHPREVYADAIADRAAGIIFVHNHPAGTPEPSHEDIDITRRLTEAGKLLGIEVVDHVILTKDAHYSFKLNGRL